MQGPGRRACPVGHDQEPRRVQGLETHVVIQSQLAASSDRVATGQHHAQWSMKAMAGSISDEAYVLARQRVDRQETFRSEYLDFERGIRVGHLAVEARLTQIMKRRLTERYGVRMLCDRWGRGVYWQWLCWVPEPNKRAKPLSAGHNFGSAKFYVTIDRAQRVFHAGMQVERAPTRPTATWPLTVEKDWDWHILLNALREDALPHHLSQLLREGFRIRVGAFASRTEYDHHSWDLSACRRKAQRFSANAWGGFQLFWPMPEQEVQATSGAELVEAILAVFAAVTPVMNLCMYAPCLPEPQRVWHTGPFLDERAVT
jgi:hypothetical protein